jgi:hypothetical protein
MSWFDEMVPTGGIAGNVGGTAYGLAGSPSTGTLIQPGSYVGGPGGAKVPGPTGEPIASFNDPAGYAQLGGSPPMGGASAYRDPTGPSYEEMMRSVNDPGNARLLEGGGGTYMTDMTGGGTSGSASQDPRAYFQSLFPGGTLTPQQLAAKEQELAAQGIRLLGPNAAGMRTKIQLPNGQIVDVIGGAGSGQNRSQWLVDRGGGGGGVPPGYWTGYRTGGGQYPLAAAGGPGLAAPWLTPFKPPNVTDDPGFQFRMEQGQKALERSAASKGTLLTGGMLKDLAGYSQGLASQEYGNAYNRALGQYTLAHDIFEQNQGNLFNRLSGIAGTGQQATGQLGQAGSAYGQSAGNIITGAGDARAAGTVGVGNAWGNAVSNIGGSIPYWYSMYQQGRNPGMGYPGTYPPTGGTPPYTPTGFM